MAALSALQGHRATVQIQPGQKVLINGASGGVCTFAVQIAKSFGAEVTGVCRTRNLDMVRSIGADHVIDYTREDFTNLRLLFEHMILGPRRSKAGGKRVGLMPTVKANKKDLVCVKELLETGKIVPVIDRCYPLRETAEAIRYLEEGHAQGKVVITLDHNSNTRPSLP